MKDNKTRPVDSYAHADFMESVFSNLRAFCDAECQRLTAGYPQLSNQNSKALTASCRRHKSLPASSFKFPLKPGPKARLNPKLNVPVYLYISSIPCDLQETRTGLAIPVLPLSHHWPRQPEK